MPIEFGVLGEVRARVGGRSIDLGPARQRCLLAVLLVEANRPVPLDRLADRVWGEERPKREVGTLHTYLSRLRSRLPSGIERSSGGYLLRVEEDAVDLHRFRTLVARARAASDAEAAALYEEALGLWRGEPFAGLETPWLDSYRHTLLAERLSARLDHVDVRLRLGRHADLRAELEPLAEEHPLDERIAGQLILALYRDGRQADALRCYERFRVRLADELGADPTPDLQRLHQQMLTTDAALAPPAPPAAPPAVPVPRQLPAAPPTFTGRTIDVAELDDALGPDGARTAVIGGPGGIGKTWLALQWAHDNAPRFPDGQLYVNLRGFDPSGSPMTPETVIRGFLAALGVEPAAMPAGLDAQVALFRSLVADKKIMIVLDNARDTAQVAPLLPGGSASAVLVTSRNQLTGLVTGYGARPVALGAFDTPTALRALTGVLGEARVHAEPDAVGAVLDRCAGLPLALGIVAARASMRPGFALADIAEELREDAHPLDALDAGEQTVSLRTVFSWSYRTLTPEGARLFRLLGLHPGPDITPHAAASLAALSPSETKRLLAELVHANLVSEHHPGRFTQHDLLRAYAAEQAQAEPPEERDAAVHRMLDHYLHTGYAAALRIYPYRDPIDLPAPHPGTAPEEIGGVRPALDWFSAEHQVLLSAIRSADPPAYVWRLAWTMVTYLDRQAQWEDLRVSHERALRANPDDPVAQAHGHSGVAIAYCRQGRPEDAIAHLRIALDRFSGQGDRAGQARMHHDLSWVLGTLGREDDALGHLEASLALYEEAGHRCGVAIARGGMGWQSIGNGDLHGAVAQCEKALRIYEELDHVYGQAGTWDTLGYAHHKLGDHARAIACYEEVLNLLAGELDARYERAQTLSRLGEAHLADGAPETARRYWRQALEILEEIRHPAAERVRGKLAAQDAVGSASP